MSNIEESLSTISKLPFLRTIFIVQSIFYIVGIPIAIIFIYYHSYFEKEDILKLLLISVFIGGIIYSCLFFTNVMCLLLTSSNNENQDKAIFQIVAVYFNQAITVTIFFYMVLYFVFDVVVDFRYILFVICLLSFSLSLAIGNVKDKKIREKFQR